MSEIFQTGLASVVLTLLTYKIGLLCQKKTGTPVCNPILIAVILVLGFLSITKVSVADYQMGLDSISWLITPATVCLAIPMYEQLQILKRNLWGILAGVVCGSLSCLGIILLSCLVARFDPMLTISLLPKSVTSAIGVPLSELSGGSPAIASAAIILSGIFANVLSIPLFRLFRLTDPIAQGVALGTSGHVLATAKANEMDPLIGAVSSLSLVTAGLLTATVFPLLMGLT